VKQVKTAAKSRMRAKSRWGSHVAVLRAHVCRRRRDEKSGPLYATTLTMIFDSTWVRLSPYISRRASARVLSTLLCAIIVVIRSFSRLGGESAFLAITVKELVFPAQNDLAQQLETTILNITGALVGIGVSAFAMFLASLVPYDSSSSRAIQAAFLIALVFCGEPTHILTV